MIINYPDTAEDNKTVFDVEEEGRCSLELVAIRYIGNRSSIPPTRLRQDAAWPGGGALQGGPLRDSTVPEHEIPGDDGEGDRYPGPAQGALIPDWHDPDTPENRTVQRLEADPDIAVLYTPEDIARAMLEANYLDPKVFGQGFDPDLRDRVFDALGIEDIGVRKEAEYREQLREIAGIDDVPEELVREETRDTARVNDYRENYPRSDLIDAARILGYERPEEAGILEMSRWLADQPRDAARFAFEGKADAARSVLAGEDDPQATEPLSADDALEAYDFDELKAVTKAVREGTGEFSLRGADAESMAAFLVETKGLTEDEIDGYLTG